MSGARLAAAIPALRQVVGVVQANGGTVKNCGKLDARLVQASEWLAAYSPEAKIPKFQLLGKPTVGEFAMQAAVDTIALAGQSGALTRCPERIVPLVFATSLPRAITDLRRQLGDEMLMQWDNRLSGLCKPYDLLPFILPPECKLAQIGTGLVINCNGGVMSNFEEERSDPAEHVLTVHGLRYPASGRTCYLRYDPCQGAMQIFRLSARCHLWWLVHGMEAYQPVDDFVSLPLSQLQNGALGIAMTAAGEPLTDTSPRLNIAHPWSTDNAPTLAMTRETYRVTRLRRFLSTMDRLKLHVVTGPDDLLPLSGTFSKYVLIDLGELDPGQPYRWILDDSNRSPDHSDMSAGFPLVAAGYWNKLPDSRIIINGNSFGFPTTADSIAKQPASVMGLRAAASIISGWGVAVSWE